MATTSRAPAPAAPRRLRLAPEERASQILDAAARLLLQEGLTEVSMERLGREAGTSKALVYNYFPNRNDLLRALLERETSAFRKSQKAQAAAAENFHDLVRRTTRMYIEHMQGRGALIRKLWAEPAVARGVADAEVARRHQTMRYLANRVAQEYGLPLEVAMPAVDLQMAMTEAAAQHFSKSPGDVEAATDFCVTLLLGGLEGLAKRHAGARKAASRPTKAAAAKVARRPAAGRRKA